MLGNCCHAKLLTYQRHIANVTAATLDFKFTATVTEREIIWTAPAVSVERARVDFVAFTIRPLQFTVPLTPHSQLSRLLWKAVSSFRDSVYASGIITDQCCKMTSI